MFLTVPRWRDCRH